MQLITGSNPDQNGSFIHTCCDCLGLLQHASFVCGPRLVKFHLSLPDSRMLGLNRAVKADHRRHLHQVGHQISACCLNAFPKLSVIATQAADKARGGVHLNGRQQGLHALELGQQGRLQQFGSNLGCWHAVWGPRQDIQALWDGHHLLLSSCTSHQSQVACCPSGMTHGGPRASLASEMSMARQA